MIRIAIVEDDARDMAQLRACLEQYGKEKKQKFAVLEFSDGEDITTDYTADYDLILMDIEMRFMNGMRAARKIREVDEDVVLMFITNMPQYAIEGYKVNALDYMLKPISYFSFSESMNKALQRLKNTGKKYIVISTKNGKMRLDQKRICYVEVLDHTLVYHTPNGNYEAKGTLRDAQNQLDDSAFFSCSRCYLVNLDYVECYQGSTITVNQDIIQVSRGRRKAFLDAMNEHMNGEM